MSDVEHAGTYRYISTPEPQRARRFARWFGGVAIAIGIALGSCFVVAYYYGPLWIPDDWDPRFRGVDGLIRRNALIGLTTEEIIARFGPARPTAYFSDWDIVYRIGNERGMFGIDSEWLVLRVRAGKVTEAAVKTD